MGTSSAGRRIEDRAAAPPWPLPRFGRFIVSGAVVGMVAAITALVVQVGVSGQAIYPGAVFYLAVTGGLLGGLAGAALAVALQRRGARQR